MKTFVFEVPRIKEETVDKLIEIIKICVDIKYFGSEKIRCTNTNTTVYSIYFKEYDEEE